MGQNFKKIIVIFEISILEFVKSESLTHTVNFGIGPAFSEGPGPGPLYKVCQVINLTVTISDHMYQFATISNMFGNIKKIDSDIYERDCCKFDRENFLLDYFSIDWEDS